jgi:predicted metalloprotease with PDZ domain
MKVFGWVGAAALASFLCAVPAGASAQAVPMRVAVDASQAPQRVYHVKVAMPVAPGPFTFVYPQWIPGYHGPVGPIEALVGLHVSAAGNALDWRRDLVDMYAVHVEVPSGVNSLDISYDIVGAESHNGQSEPVSTPNLALVEYSNMVVYPQGAKVEALPVDASLTLPAGWKFGTALPVKSVAGNTVAFQTEPLYTVVDSPVIAGLHFAAFPLGGEQELDVAADGAQALKIRPAMLEGMKHLVAEGPALYGSKHYRDYHFLLTLSDNVGFEGIEHHESSDDRASEDYLTDATALRTAGSLLPHEYSHSWNGKYRRPAKLYQPDYQTPEQTDLLWVYEGLNEYNGEVLATRARIQTFREQLDVLAEAAAQMQVESGRGWRPIRDTADGAPFLYEAPEQFYDVRRSAGDFYTEGDLIWLDADVTIRRLTHGAKSLDDFDKLWGSGGSTTPSVAPYTAETVYGFLNQVVAYDWPGFFKARIATVQPKPPLDGITGGGYRLAYSSTQSDFQKDLESTGKHINARYSIGVVVSTDDGTISDVVGDSVAFKAGIAPGAKIVALDGRKFTPDRFHETLKAHAGSSAPLELLVNYDDVYTTYRIDASSGERYPHLERVDGTPDLLEKVYAPKTFTPAKE